MTVSKRNSCSTWTCGIARTERTREASQGERGGAEGHCSDAVGRLGAPFAFATRPPPPKKRLVAPDADLRKMLDAIGGQTDASAVFV